MDHRRASALLLVASLAAICAADAPPAGLPLNASAEQNRFTQFVKSNCLDCHNNATKTAGLSLDDLVAQDIDENQRIWEQVVRKLVERQMPPRETGRPDEKDYDAAVTWLSSSLDSAAANHLNPGRTETFRRLNRTEYQNAIRDLLGVDIDVSLFLPPDESSHGFDNITVTNFSPAQLNGYLTAAQKISRLAIGSAPRRPSEEVFRIRPDITQDAHIEGLPIGTRGGMLIPYNFPQGGEYDVEIRLMRDRNEEVESLRETHEVEVLLDQERVKLFAVKPPERGAGHQSVDAHLKARIKTTAGPHKVGVTFWKNQTHSRRRYGSR